ncbi:hypothetical protein OOK27_51210 [Streptomyces canus]|nr:hypothetical protein [Streptomyces canus]MCX5262389.1 hypothetical protein [Streptomyces canus]
MGPRTIWRSSYARCPAEGGTVPSLTDDQAADIVTAVKSSFCD